MGRINRSFIWLGGGLCLLSLAAFVGAHLRAAVGAHLPVAPWDYVDSPNSHPTADGGPVLGDPRHAIDAVNDEATLPNGTTVQLLCISKGNTMNTHHMWAPDGTAFFGGNPSVDYYPDEPPANDGPRRELFFQVNGEDVLSGLLQGRGLVSYIPGSARAGLDPDRERPFHGWGAAGSGNLGVNSNLILTYYVDNLSATSLVVGFVEGFPATVGSFPDRLKPKGNPVGEVIGQGAWGKAIIVPNPWAERQPGYFDPGGPFPAARIALVPHQEPAESELSLVGLDANGGEYELGSSRGMVTVSHLVDHKIVRFEVQSRPYTFVKFSNVHYDPSPEYWKNVVWGADQPHKEKEVNGIKVDLTSLSPTNLAGRDQYVADDVLNIDGKLWLDRPRELANLLVFSGATGFPGEDRILPRPWIATLGCVSPENEEAEGRIIVGGSSSPVGGQDFHPEWNSWPKVEAPEGRFIPLANHVYLPFSLLPRAKYVQFRIDAVSGPWRTVASFVPPDSKLRPPKYGDTWMSLEVGRDISESYFGASGTWDAHTLGHFDPDRFQSQVVAHMNGGGSRALKVTSYFKRGQSELDPCYDFGLHTPSRGDFNGIPLSYIERLEVQCRPIQQGYLVQELPKSGVEAMASGKKFVF